MNSATRCSNNSTSISVKALWIAVYVLVSMASFGQVTYRVGLDTDNKTYRLYMKSAVGYTNAQAKISTAQMTIVVPHGSGANQFLPTNMRGKQVGTEQMTWSISRINAPIENPLLDYISFGYSGSGNPILFSINANEEIELLNFQHLGNCTGIVKLITGTDPFLAPNSKNSNPANQITILGFGAGNAYSANYGGNVNCQNQSPDLTIGLTGSSTITSGINTNYSILVSNIGSVASAGQITVSTTLPTGVSYNSFTGAGWSVNAATQSNGTTIITATSNATVANGGSANQLLLNVTAGASVGNSITLTSTVSGGGDVNLSNNTANMSSAVAVAMPNLSLILTGSSTMAANTSGNYTLNIANNGSSATSGTVSASIILPNGLSYTSFTGNGWAYGSSTLQNGGAIKITFTNNAIINANASANPLVLNLTAGSNVLQNMVLPLIATITGGGDITLDNKTASVNITIVGVSSPNLTLALSGANSIVAGSSNNFTINVGNSGTTATAGQITLTTTLPAGFAYNSFVGVGWNVVATPQANGTTLLTATYNGSLQAGAVANPLIINFTPQLNSGTGASYIISGSVSGGGVTNNVSANYSTVVTSPSNVTMLITGSNNITAGSTGNYTFTLINNGSTPSTANFTNIITLPAGVSYNSFTGNGWNFINAVLQPNGTTILTFTHSNTIAGGGSSSPLNLNLSFANNLTNNSNLTINSNLSGGGNITNTNFILTVLANQKPDLTLNINGTTTTSPGGTAAYTVVVNNTGNAPTTGQITASVSIPNGLTYTSFSGNGWTYGSSTLQTGGAILVTFTTNQVIGVGNSANNLVINLIAGNSLANNTNLTITVSTSGGGETNTTNNTASTNLIISTQGSQMLSASITGLTVINANVPYNYTINLSNTSNVATTGPVIVNTILPAGIIYNSSSGIGWTSTAVPQSNGTTLIVSTYSGIIPRNGSANGLILNIIPSGTLPAGSVVLINGSILGGGSNSTFSINLTVSSSNVTADLGVSVVLDNKTPALGQIINYTFSINNGGTGSPQNILNQISLPAGFVLTNFDSNGGNYDPKTGLWTIGLLPSGQTYKLTISGKPSIEGIDFATIQLITSSLQDNNLSNNMANVCYATPVSLCAGEGYVAYLGKQNSNFKWFRNSTQISNATADSLLITTTGVYSAIYINSCGETINTPSLTITAGALPNSPTITANKSNICINEAAQLTASSCGLGTLTWSTGVTASTISISTAGTYTATCTDACGTSQASSPFVLNLDCQNIGRIGDLVWYDTNNNGKQDIGEMGVKDIILELFKDGIFTGITTTTDNLGKYLFPNLASGNYQVKIIKTSLPPNYLLSAKSNLPAINDSLDTDFDFTTAFSQIVNINTATPTQASNLTIDAGIRLKPEATISDPCKCFGVEYDLNEKKELFETVTINASSNETWRVIQQTGMLVLDSLNKKPVPLGTTFVEVSAGKYELIFTHEDNVGYTLNVTNGTDTLSIKNFCSVYPRIKVTEFSETICRNSPPIPLTIAMNQPETAQYFYVDKISKQKIIITAFDPSKFASGETISIKIDVKPTDGRFCSYIITQTVKIGVNDCDISACKPQICVPVSVQKTKK